MADRPDSDSAARQPRRGGRALLDQAGVQRIFGKRIELDGVTIIPVAAVRRCRCGPGGEENGKGGRCSSARPVGLVVIRDGRVEWQPAIDLSRLALIGAATLGLVVLLKRRR